MAKITEWYHNRFAKKRKIYIFYRYTVSFANVYNKITMNVNIWEIIDEIRTLN